MRKSPAKMLTLTALFAALGAALGYLDAILPTLDFLPLPGVKLGLANLATMLALYLLGAPQAAAVSLVRILLVNLLLFPSATALIFSLAGGVFSFCVMLLLKKTSFHPVCVSIGGACTHNLAQLVAAAILFSTPKIFSYAVFLFPVGILTGALLGLLLTLIVQRAGKIKEIT